MCADRRLNYDEIKAKALRGPRVTTLLHHFEEIASGSKLVPRAMVEPAAEFMDRDIELRRYYEIYRSNLGAFNWHAIASIPFALEQCIRMGVGLCRFASSKTARSGEQFTFYGTSTGDGTHARAIAEYSRGKIVTLTDSPNISNYREFKKRLRHEFSFFHVGPFVDITPEYVHGHSLPAFWHGFDVIWESTTFQMYGDNREEQIAYVKRVIKPGGLMIFLEKMAHDDADVYARREAAKDVHFKSRYFSDSDIQRKKDDILFEMERGQVTLAAFSKAVSANFEHAAIVWNSGNFYEVVASDSEGELAEFLSLLPEPYIASEVLFDVPLGRSLF